MKIKLLLKLKYLMLLLFYNTKFELKRKSMSSEKYWLVAKKLEAWLKK